MKNNNQRSIDSLVNKILSETLEEKANNLVSRLKHKEVNELGGMEDGHPKFGKKNFSDMSSDEIADLLKNYDSEDEDFGYATHNGDFGGDDSDEEINELGGMDDGHPKFGKKNFAKMSPEEIDDLLANFGDDDFEDGVDEYSDEEKHEYNDDDFDNQLDENESEICECGGNMYEGVCNECGGSYGMMDEEDDDEFGFESSDDDRKTCEFHREHFGDDDERTQRFCKTMNESLKGGQKKLDKNKNNKIDAEDFKLLRGKKTETKESKPDFLDLNKNGDKKEPMKKAAKDAKKKEVDESWDTETKTPKSEKGKYKGKSLEELKSMLSNVKKSGPHKKGSDEYEKQNELEFAIRAKSGWGKVNESLRLAESELINLIESIVKENLRTTGDKPKGLGEYEKAHNGSGKENEEYIKSVTKKMKDYLKDGSKGDYEMNPKMFPKGNGEIEKMKTKKYTMSKDGDDFIDDFMRPGMENLEYDEIQPNEEWMESNIEGSSKTGNNPKWANAEETDLGKKINKKRKENKFAKLRNKAYNKAAQPITDRTGDESGNGINIKLESTDKQTKVLNEEFTKIQHLMGYNRKTQ